MPRATRVPAILRTRQRNVVETIKPGMPRLWNAKRRIKQSQGLSIEQYKQYKMDPKSNAWRAQVSPDVVEFYDTNKEALLPEDREALLRNPSYYFSRPYRVPEEQRKQVYFPSFEVIFMRTPHLGPYYASFKVPLWFNKLDMRSYLSSLYNVSAVHVRSYVTPAPIRRKTPLNKKSRGEKFRPKSHKKMTVQLIEPFIWPEEVKEFDEWEKDEYWRVGKAQVDMQRQEGQWGTLNPNRRLRKSIAEQAMDLLQGKTKWQPTWKQIPMDARVLEGSPTAAPPPS